MLFEELVIDAVLDAVFPWSALEWALDGEDVPLAVLFEELVIDAVLDAVFSLAVLDTPFIPLPLLQSGFLLYAW